MRHYIIAALISVSAIAHGQVKETIIRMNAATDPIRQVCQPGQLIRYDSALYYITHQTTAMQTLQAVLDSGWTVRVGDGAGGGADSSVYATHYYVDTSVASRVYNVMVNHGDMIRLSSDGVPERLAVGTSGQVLTSDGTLPAWTTPTGVDTTGWNIPTKEWVTAKGYRPMNNHDSLSSLDEKSYNSLTDRPSSWAINQITGLIDSLTNRYRRGDTSSILLTQARALSTYEPKVTASTTGKYYRGDKSFQYISTFSNANKDTTNMVLFFGDSMTVGWNCTTSTPPSDYVTVPTYNGLTFKKVNIGQGSLRTVWADSVKMAQIMSNYDNRAGKNIVVMWLGINDLFFGRSAGQTYSTLEALAIKIKAMGYRVIMTTLPSNQSKESGRNSLNTIIRTNWKHVADGLADLAANTTIGDDGDWANTTYFCDGTHLTQAGSQVAATVFQSALTELITNERNKYFRNVVADTGRFSRLAVNTTNPDSVVTVNGSFRAGNTKTVNLNSTGILTIGDIAGQPGGGVGKNFRIYYDNNNNYTVMYGANWGSAFTDLIINKDGGNVKIGATSGTGKLYVNGDIGTASYGKASDWYAKQAALVSGTNIKTINGNSLLGSGDLTITSGGTYSAGYGLGLNSTTFYNSRYQKDIDTVKSENAGLLKADANGVLTGITDNSSNWNSAYGWGNHASAGYVTGTPWTSAGYLTANQSITLSGDASGTGATAITVTVADDSHAHVISNIDNLQDTVNNRYRRADTSTVLLGRIRAASTYQPKGTYVTSVAGTSPVASSGGTTPTVSINTDTLTAWHTKQNQGATAYSWGNHSTQNYVVNPMVNPGDMIRLSSNGVPERLAVGTNGQVLTSNGTLPVWSTPSGVSSDSVPWRRDNTRATTSLRYPGDKVHIGAATTPDSTLKVTGGVNVTRGLKTGNDAVINGVRVGRGAKGTAYCTSVGYNALGTSLLYGDYNSAFGYNAMAAITNGSSNTAVGKDAMKTNTRGDHNTAIGANALEVFSVESDGGNTAIGSTAMQSTTTGTRSTAVGYGALINNTTGNYNIAIGYNTIFRNTTGSRNVAIGRNALYGVYGSSTSSNNTTIGDQSLYSTSTGFSNTAVGVSALYSNTTGYRNIALGDSAGYSYTTLSNRMYLGARDTTGTTGGIYFDRTPAKRWGKWMGTLKVTNIPADAAPDSVLTVVDGLIKRAAFPTGGSGTVTSISQGTGMLNSADPITTTGTIGVDTTKVVMFNDTLPAGKIATSYALTTGLAGKQAAGSYVTSVGATSPVASSGGTTPTVSINTDTLAAWHTKQNQGATAYGWGNPAGVYEPIIDPVPIAPGNYYAKHDGAGQTGWQEFPAIPAAYDTATNPFKYLSGNTVQRGTGNVGIGTTAPAAKVHISAPKAVALAISTDNDGSFGDSTAVYVDAAGRVGIGTTAPSAKHHVAGTIKSDGTITPGLTALGAIGATETVNLAKGNTFTITCDASTTITLEGGQSGATYTFVFTHENSSTAYTVAWSPTLKWAGGTALTFTNTANAVDIVVIKNIGGTYYASGSANFK